MSRRRVVEETVSHERWLVSYADFITLLFAFFVVMYSISQVNEGKYKVLSETLTDVFTHDSVAASRLTIDPFQIGEEAKSNSLNVIDFGGSGLLAQNEEPVQENTEQANELPVEFQNLNEQIDQVFDGLQQQDMFTVRGNEEWLEVELKSSLLFSSGDAELSDSALLLLGSIADILRNQSNPIRVEGFTDNIPINTGQFPSNWELSTARAASVVKLFIEEGLDAERFAAIGYGEFQPIADNSTVDGREANRRVVLMISKTGELRPELREVTTTDDLVNGALPVESVNTGIEIIIPGVSNEQAEEDVEVNDPPGVRTIELEDGGLLFTNDQP